MHKIIIAAALAVVLAVLPHSAEGAYQCVNADAFQIPASSSCTKVAIDSGLGSAFGTSTVVRCPTTGTPIFFVDISVPPDWDDDMTINNEWIDWMVGTEGGAASSGNVCWKSGMQAVRAGQDFLAGQVLTTSFSAVAMSATNIVTSADGGGTPVLADAVATGCDTTPATCRLRPLHIGVSRNNTCTSNANGTVSFVKYCFEY